MNTLADLNEREKRLYRLNVKRQWNSVYKRFECRWCDEQWNIGEKHICAKFLNDILQKSEAKP